MLGALRLLAPALARLDDPTMLKSALTGWMALQWRGGDVKTLCKTDGGNKKIFKNCKDVLLADGMPKDLGANLRDRLALHVGSSIVDSQHGASFNGTSYLVASLSLSVAMQMWMALGLSVAMLFVDVISACALSRSGTLFRTHTVMDRLLQIFVV